MIPRSERIEDYQRAQTLAKQLAAIRHDAIHWLEPEPGLQAPASHRLTDELIRLGKKYGVGRDCARANTLQEFMVGILHAIDNLDPTVPYPIRD